MDCKKFNIGSKTPETEQKKEPSSREMIRSVSTIEIKSSAIREKRKTGSTKKHEGRKHIAAFCGICALTILMFSAIPIPKPIENMLFELTELITEPLSQDTQTINRPISANSVKLMLPAATDSTIIDTVENNIPSPEYSAPVTPLSANMSSIANETSYNIIIEDLLSHEYPIEKISDPSAQVNGAVSVFAQDKEPSVLIIHTHGTESYNDSASNNYRTQDKSRNVVAAGRLLSEKLNEHGISAIHCETMFDENSYIKAYSNSYSQVSEYLAEYPSIKYVIDLHRDAIPDTDGNGYAQLTSFIDGKACAQLMLVVGTNEAGAKHPQWQDNLRTALEIQKNMCKSYPTLMRSINLRRASFNQQLCTGYFILEAGNCENNIDEVFASIELFAKVFADTVSE